MVFSINPTAEKTQAMFQALAIAQNGAGAGTALTGGTPAAGGNGTAAPVTAAPAAAAPVAAAPADVSTGTGSVAGGQCICAVTCTAGVLPAANVQGLGAFGGMTGESRFFLPIGMNQI